MRDRAPEHRHQHRQPRHRRGRARSGAVAPRARRGWRVPGPRRRSGADPPWWARPPSRGRRCGGRRGTATTASGTAIRPAVAISNSPSSFVGPKRCFDARSSRSAWWRSPSNCNTVSTTCSSTRGPARPPSLVTWPTSTIDDVALLGLVDEPLGAPADLADAAGQRTERRVGHGLDRVDHDQLGADSFDRFEDVRQRRLGVQPQVVAGGAEALGTALDLLGALLGGDVQRRAAPCGEELQQQRALADARFAAEQRDRAGDEAAAEHSVEFGDGGGDRIAVFGADVADAGRPRACRCGDRRIVGRLATSTSSTRVFQSPQPAHRPAHFGCEVPHSLHTWTNFALLMPAIMTRGCRRVDGAGASTSSVEGDDLAAVDAHPVASFEIRAEPIGDHSTVVAVLRALQLEQVGELEPGRGRLPQAQCGSPVGGSSTTGPNRHSGSPFGAMNSGKNSVGTPYPPAATTRSCSARTSSWVV